ncbi:DNA polymerase ligase N-terminal domain-containing protein [Flavobacterium ardleyense]|uniref:DNA polymerase ligase N-terminal domain-containing protein n=1 Tax=Flavobacterium ardleyense TaxID=2038737 RepID=UPI00298D532B|nr:DNA polymerase ligase N-terminal domain-containing protein [Flavobacterium ardleyense]
MDLQTYNKKRDFDKTKEPKGRTKKSQGALRFVVQKHAASHLHYDFRLEIDGVLVSWAVPKGPSADPADRRLAVHVENHPMDYINFEGTIPEGEYGGGTVMVWDTGTYHAEGNEDIKKDNSLMQKQIEDGSIKIVLEGTKLKGTWHLVKMKGDDKNWLLMKNKSDALSKQKEFTSKSILSDRTMDEISESNTEWSTEAEHQKEDTENLQKKN